MKTKSLPGDFLRDLQRLVEMESCTRDRAGVNAVADFFDREFRALGWTVGRADRSDGRCGDMLKMRNSDAETADVLLLGHMDTVFPKGTLAGFPFGVESNRVRGPGVADMKGGLLFIRELARQLAHEKVNLAVLLNSDEEITSPYSGPLVRSLAKRSRYTLVFEPARPNGGLVIKRKGVAVYQIGLTGKAAHSGANPQDGVSAVSELARWILELDRLTDFAAGTTLNMGVISGGEAKNIIPASARGTLDVRFTDVAAPQQVERRMLELSSTARPGLSAQWRQDAYRPPMNPTAATRALCETAREIAGREAIPGITFEETGGASDGNLAADAGSICLDGMGPIGGGFHSTEEYLLLDSVEPRIRLARELILHLASQQSRRKKSGNDPSFGSQVTDDRD